MQKLVFAYGSLGSYKKLKYIDQVGYEEFYSYVKVSNISEEEHLNASKIIQDQRIYCHEKLRLLSKYRSKTI